MVEVASYLAYFFYAFASVFIIVNPVEATMVFISLTPGATARERARLSFRAATVAYLVALLFALTGDMVLRFFGTTVDSLRVAGGILLFIMAIDMLKAKPRRKVTDAEMADATDREDVSVFPLATPLLTGPGAITTVIVLMGTASELAEKGVVLLALTATFAATYLILRSSEYVSRILGVTGILVMTRIMGLMLGAIAVNFVAVGAWNIYAGLAGPS
ncbi:MAG TPA: NAAT family transporter [Methanothrix sp.]|nr:NAAT family transporter [Methanothrix sp.]HPJ84203.1 NAAT family transporter [Methanothrix sp.]HPR66105.1 NAAT family transporter [Methanothrix sp.]